MDIVESVPQIFFIVFIKFFSGFAPSLLLALLCLQGAAGSVTLAHFEQWIAACAAALQHTGSAEHLGGWHAQHCHSCDFGTQLQDCFMHPAILLCRDRGKRWEIKV